MNFVKLLRVAGLIGLSCVTASAQGAEGLVFSGLGLTPQTRAVPGNTLVLMARVGNAGSEPATGTIVASVEQLPYLQTARVVRLEPGDQRSVELFIQLPASMENVELYEHLNVVATMYVRDGEREVILQRDGQPVTQTLSLSVVPQGRIMCFQAAPDPPEVLFWDWPRPVESSGYEFAVAARVDAIRDRKSISYDGRPLPLQLVEWDALDLFVIANPEALQDPAALEAMRQFMVRGGRVWVMLDQVPSDLIQPLLGPEQSLQEVERVMIDDFSVEVSPPAEHLSEGDLRIASGSEVVMARVVQSGGRVLQRVDGWPASIAMPVGYGQLLLTTLDSSAWIEPRLEQRSTDPSFQSNFTVRRWGANWAADANAHFPVLPLTDESEYPLLRIGNPVVPRGWVATALFGFCIVLAAVGAWLAAARHQTWIGWIAPGLAVMTSLSLLLAASWVRREIPESVSRLQVVDVGDDGALAIVREQSAVFLDRLSPMQLDSQFNGAMRSSDSVTSGVRRFVVEDFERWSVTNEAWPPGSWRYQAQFALPTVDLTVRGSLTDKGLQLEMPAELPAPLEDPVLGFVVGDPLLCRAAAGGVEVDERLTVGEGRWIAGSILSAEQQRRMDIYQQFFEPNEDLQRPARRLYGWTPPWPTSGWNRELNQPGAALVALPVRLQRPAVGQEVFLPHGLIQLRRGLNAQNVTATYDDRTGVWRKELLVAVDAELDFVLPPEVVPFSASSLALELDIRAPERKVTVSAIGPSGPIELAQLDSPSLPWSATITDPSVLQLVEDGRLEVLLRISPRQLADGTDADDSYVTWQIAHFHASLRGSVQAQSTLTPQP